MYQVRLRFDFEWSPVAVLSSLALLELSILTLDVLSYRYVEQPGLQELLDLSLEGNIATFFAAAQALFVGMAAFAISTHYPNQTRRYAWLGVASFFTFIAVDDAAQIHERVATAWGRSALAGDGSSLSARAAGGFASYWWQLLFLPFFAAAGVAMAAFAVREFGGIRHAWLFLAGLAFYANAVVLDYFDAIERSYELIMHTMTWTLSTTQHVFRDIEEFIEMFGTTCILVAFLSHYARVCNLPNARTRAWIARS